MNGPSRKLIAIFRRRLPRLAALWSRAGGDGLRRRAARGAVWLGAGSTVEHAVRFARNLVLVRLLAPESFGVMGIVLATTSAIEAFTEVGTSQAVIQSPQGARREYLNGVWWFSVARGLVLYALSFALAPALAAFYGQPELVPLMRTVCLCILFNAAISPRLYVALKEMRYARYAAVSHGAALIGIGLTLVLALTMRNVWALALGYLAEIGMVTLLSHVLCPFAPTRRCDRESLRALLKYASGMVGIPILVVIFLRGEVFVVGKLCSAEDLGLYVMILTLGNIPVQLVSKLLPHLAMPAFAEMQRDPARVNRTLLAITRTIVALGLPLLAGAVFYGHPALSVLYGERYAALAVPFALVTASALLRLLSVPVASIYLGLGCPSGHREFAALRAILLALPVVPAVRAFGVTGAALATLAASLAASLYHVWRLRPLTGLRLRTYAAAWAGGAWPALVVAAVWLATRGVLPPAPPVRLVVGAAACLLSTAAALRLVRRACAGHADLPTARVATDAA